MLKKKYLTSPVFSHPQITSQKLIPLQVNCEELKNENDIDDAGISIALFLKVWGSHPVSSSKIMII